MRRFVKLSILRRSNVPVRELFDYAGAQMVHPGGPVVVKVGALCAGFAGLLFFSGELQPTQVILTSATIDSTG